MKKTEPNYGLTLSTGRFNGCALAEPAKKPEKHAWLALPAGTKLRGMNPTQKQFSLNRGASKSKFLSVTRWAGYGSSASTIAAPQVTSWASMIWLCT